MTDTIQIQLTVNDAPHLRCGRKVASLWLGIGIPGQANAIYNAVGVRITLRPITAAKIKAALENVGDN